LNGDFERGVLIALVSLP